MLEIFFDTSLDQILHIIKHDQRFSIDSENPPQNGFRAQRIVISLFISIVAKKNDKRFFQIQHSCIYMVIKKENLNLFSACTRARKQVKKSFKT